MLTNEQRIFLADSPEFQQWISTDPVLNDLYRPADRKAEELAALMDLCGFPVRYKQYQFPPITPFCWSLLWTIGNPYAMSSNHIEEKDSAIFLFLLMNQDSDFSEEKICLLPIRASMWFRGSGIDKEEAAKIIIGRIRQAFAPLKTLPQQNGFSDEIPDFGIEWITVVCSVAAKESGITFVQMLHRPLSLCFSLFVNRIHRLKGGPYGQTRMNDQSMEQFFQQIERLGEQFCREHFNSARQSSIRRNVL